MFVSGRMAPAYRKRQCHRYLKHRYFFSSSDRRERKRVLLSGGLNKASRSLLKKMKKCSVVINKIGNDDTKEDEVNNQGRYIMVYSFSLIPCTPLEILEQDSRQKPYLL